MFIFIVFLIIIALFLQSNSKKGDLHFLDAAISSSVNITEPGEEFTFSVELRNRSWRILPFLKLRIYVPGGIEFPHLTKGSVSQSTAGGQELTLTTWLMPRQRLVMEIPAVIGRRGRYFANGLVIASGDFFGVSEMYTRYDDFVEVICLPKEADSDKALQIAGGFPGDLSVNRFIFDDPSLTIGAREYTGREPMKQISWLRSAQSGRLMVKEMDHTLESSVTVVLNIDTDIEARQDSIELAYSMGRYVCRKLEDDRLSYAFATNTDAIGDIKSYKYVGEGLGRMHFSHILEGLGRATYTCSMTNDQLIDLTVKKSSGSFGLVYITAGNDKDQCRQAIRLAQKAGLQVYCINTGGEE
ncbi:MAG: DUF58 domain-containing protein [Firmicutes bacterium]|nr:DUF58 domain-containing protein [Bacillota bacterium]